jgi:hypothetical protein
MTEAPVLHEPIWLGFSFAQLVWLCVAAFLMFLIVYRRVKYKIYDWLSIFMVAGILLPWAIVSVIIWIVEWNLRIR